MSFPDKIQQSAVKAEVLSLFSGKIPFADRLISAFDHTEIDTRNFCRPLDYYRKPHTFQDRNREYIAIAVEYAARAADDALSQAGIARSAVTDIVVVSTTGLATPSLDALLINTMRLNADTRRLPVWGLGCAGGVAGLAKACTLAKADPSAVVLFIAVELCSLTLIKSDFSKSNFIGSSLFSDGIAALVITGDAVQNPPASKTVTFLASRSRLYYDSLDVMGWDFMDDGFKVLFSKDIPSIISKYVKEEVDTFLAANGLTRGDVKNFIFHPGGKKVIDAYLEALDLPPEKLQDTIAVMKENGNMSSATVLYVLERFLTRKSGPGYGLMMAMGPGFSSEMVLLKFE